ncbi:MAG: circadian clock protein LdpA [Elainellaceae cyanobacterium]
MTNVHDPLRSLQRKCWFKLICGASFQHLPAVRSLALAYGLAGSDCVDVAADPAVVAAVRSAQAAIASLAPEAHQRGFRPQVPWLMISLNDGDDPHFRKAVFDPALCPPDCPRPCEAVCPAEAIVPESGVLSERCYGCGRCLPVCPPGQISAQSYRVSPEAVAPLVMSGIDAVEIHTQVGHYDRFRSLWQRAIAPQLRPLKLVAVSCPDGEGVIEYLRSLHALMTPLPCALVWQVDGRPMSGDLGKGTTHATLRLAQKLAAARLPGYIQLAGGTNRHTVPALRRLQYRDQSGLLQQSGAIAAEARLPVAGIAYGSYARTQLMPTLEQLEAVSSGSASVLEAHPDLLWQAVAVAHSLVFQVKGASKALAVSIEPPFLEGYSVQVSSQRGCAAVVD